MIVFMAPDEEIFATAQATLSSRHPDIRIEKGLLSAGVVRARELAGQGVEIIITRGGTASAIKEALPDMIVVDIPITGFDVLRTVEEASRHGHYIGVVAFPSMVIGIDCLAPILDVEFRHYLLQNEFEAESLVLEAIHARGVCALEPGASFTLRKDREVLSPTHLCRTGVDQTLGGVAQFLVR